MTTGNAERRPPKTNADGQSLADWMRAVDTAVRGISGGAACLDDLADYAFYDAWEGCDDPIAVAEDMLYEAGFPAELLP